VSEPKYPCGKTNTAVFLCGVYTSPYLIGLSSHSNHDGDINEKALVCLSLQSCDVTPGCYHSENKSFRLSGSADARERLF
jgi:hypothetical protein